MEKGFIDPLDKRKVYSFASVNGALIGVSIYEISA